MQKLENIPKKDGFDSSGLIQKIVIALVVLILVIILIAVGQITFLLQIFGWLENMVRSATGADLVIAKGIAALLLAAILTLPIGGFFLSFIPFPQKNKKRKRLIVLAVFALLCFVSYFSSRNVFFDPETGKPSQYYSISPDGKYKFYSSAGYDPVTGDSLKTVTKDVVLQYMARSKQDSERQPVSAANVDSTEIYAKEIMVSMKKEKGKKFLAYYKSLLAQGKVQEAKDTLWGFQRSWEVSGVYGVQQKTIPETKIVREFVRDHHSSNNKNLSTDAIAINPDKSSANNGKALIEDYFGGDNAEDYKGSLYGITVIRRSDIPTKTGALFSQKKESRIQYPFSIGFPREGRVEILINVMQGYAYDNFSLNDNLDRAVIFTTGHSDVWNIGAMWLAVSKSGEISLTTATAFGSPKFHILTAEATPFRFNEWHTVSFSYGRLGQSIKIDGELVASNPSYTEPLQACSGFNGKKNNPTIGEESSVFWENNRYDHGFEGIVGYVKAFSL